jgi:hypothetical protein
MTTRAEEITAEGPYRVVDAVYVEGPTGRHGRYWNERDAESHAKQFNAAYKQGQQDRWISVEERLPEPNIEVLVAFADDTVAGTSQWCRVKSPDIMGWLGPAENKGKVITHWMPLPPNPEQP